MKSEFKATKMIRNEKGCSISNTVSCQAESLSGAEMAIIRRVYLNWAVY